MLTIINGTSLFRALKAKFEINYTSLPEATNGKLSEKDDSVMRKRLEIDKCGDNLFVYIRLKARDTIEYALGDIDGKIDKDTIKQLCYKNRRFI